MIRAKLKDNTGASITYALLLFLVCAVVGSVVLAAGTAAAGRMSQSVESDQRYYSVTSAARLFRELIDGKNVKVVKTIEDGETAFTIDGAPVGDGYAYTILTDAAAYNSGQKEGSPEDRRFQVTVGDKQSLTVDVIEKLDTSNARITLVLSNAPTEKNSQKYTITLVFDADILEESETSEITSVNDSTGVITTSEKETVTTDYTWSLTKMAE